MLLNVKLFFKDVILAKEMGIWVLVSWGLVKFWKLEGGRWRRCLLEVRCFYGPEYSFQFFVVVLCVRVGQLVTSIGIFTL